MGGVRGSLAVVGAGPAGLAAAWRLSAGGPVRLYEARSRPGGRLRTEEVAGTRADAVVQLLSDGYAETRRLLDAMGLADRLMEVPGRDALWRGGRAHVLRYGSVLSMAASGALPAGLKLRLGLRYVPFLERHGEALDLNDPGRAPEALAGESIAAWGRRELGDDFVELMAYPLLASYYGVTPEETSAAFFHALARVGQRVSVLGMRGGAGALAEAMAGALTARGVELRLGGAVDGIEAGPEGVTVHAGEPGSHDGVVVATPAPVAARLLDSPALGAVATRSTATLVLAVDRSVETGWFGLSIPRTEAPGDVLATVCVQSEKATDLGGTGDALVLVPAPAVAEDWARSEAGAVVAEAIPALERVLPGVGARVREARLIRLEDTVFVPAPGAGPPGVDRASAAGSGAAPGPGPSPGAGSSPVDADGSHRIAVAGDHRVAPTVEGAIRSGLAAAAALSRGGA